MKKPAPNRIAEERRSSGMSQQELADAVGAHWITISKLERGKIKLTTEWMEKIAKALVVHQKDLLRETKPIVKAVVVGTVASHGAVFIFPKAQWTETSVKNTHFSAPGGFWLNVHSHRHMPVLHPGDFIFMIPLRAAVARKPLAANVEALAGRLAFVELEKGRGQIGFLYGGSKPGLWDLFWLSGRIQHDVRPKRIAVVSATLSTFR